MTRKEMESNDIKCVISWKSFWKLSIVPFFCVHVRSKSFFGIKMFHDSVRNGHCLDKRSANVHGPDIAKNTKIILNGPLDGLRRPTKLTSRHFDLLGVIGQVEVETKVDQLYSLRI